MGERTTSNQKWNSETFTVAYKHSIEDMSVYICKLKQTKAVTLNINLYSRCDSNTNWEMLLLKNKIRILFDSYHFVLIILFLSILFLYYCFIAKYNIQNIMLYVHTNHNRTKPFFIVMNLVSCHVKNHSF